MLGYCTLAIGLCVISGSEATLHSTHFPPDGFCLLCQHRQSLRQRTLDDNEA